MTGEYKHSIDTKGRIFIPSKIKEELGNVFYITISSERCLLLYSKSNWDELSDKAKSLPYSRQIKLRPIFSMAAKCEIDSQGRVLIPLYLRSWADFDKEVTVVGNNNHAEIWNSSIWEMLVQKETLPDNVASAMEEFCF